MTPTDNKAPMDINKYRKGLACLVPKEEAECALTSHEYSLCDCKVLEIFSYADKIQSRLEKCEGLLRFIFNKADLGKIHALDYYDADGDPVCKKWCSACEIIKRKEKYFAEAEK